MKVFRPTLRSLPHLFLVWCCFWQPLTLAQDNDLEYQIKAAFLYQFATYVEWPATAFARPDSPLVFGVLGSQSMYENLQSMIPGHTINGRPIVVERIDADSPQDNLHVLFVGQTPDSGMLPLQPGTRPVLIVTETPEFRPQESMINFSLVDNRVKFDVALAPAELAGLKLSARLLQVAKQVVRP